MNDRIVMGIVGTAVSATGASLSVNEIQAIVSIIVTIAGFLIGVVWPLIAKLVKYIKAKKNKEIK